MTDTKHPADNPAAIAFYERLSATPHHNLAQLCLKMTDTVEALSSVGLGSVRPFAIAYEELTYRADEALQAGMFADPPTTERLACNFAGLYFNALGSHLSGKQGAVPRSWQQLFGSRNQPAWLQLALGVNAHIGHDLPLALQATGVPPEYGNSFFGLNRAIKSVAPELAPVFLPALPDRLQSGAAIMAAKVIIGWREQAWRSFMRLQAGATNHSAIEAGAARRGRRLQRTASVLGMAGLHLSA
jgi:hypothetical protein